MGDLILWWEVVLWIFAFFVAKEVAPFVRLFIEYLISK